MRDFLAEVVDERRERVAALRPRRAELAERSARRASPPRDLARALRARAAAGDVPVIAEVKRRSPSAGDIVRIDDPAPLALEYALGGAAAISVLTEERHFRGSLSDMERVRETVRLPVLRKDFIVDELQVLEAHAHGADAVLLIADALDDHALGSLLAAARELGLAALVEAHADDALDHAVASGAELIGINQRDLRTLELDVRTIARLAPRVPADRLLVAESGIATAADVRALPARVDALLVGTALAGAGSPRRLVRELVEARRVAA